MLKRPKVFIVGLVYYAFTTSINESFYENFNTTLMKDIKKLSKRRRINFFFHKKILKIICKPIFLKYPLIFSLLRLLFKGYTMD